MKKKTFARLFPGALGIALLAPLLAVPSRAQCAYGNCSTAYMTLTGSTEECQEPTNPVFNTPYPGGGTDTYLDTAYSSDGFVYYSQSARQTVPMIAK